MYNQQQKRWNNLCDKTQQRQEELNKLWEDWNKFLAEHDLLEDWIRKQAQHITNVEKQASKVTYESLDDLEKELVAMKQAQDVEQAQLDRVNDLYCNLAKGCQLDTSDNLKTKYTDVNKHWNELEASLEALLKKIRNSRQLYLSYRDLRLVCKL